MDELKDNLIISDLDINSLNDSIRLLILEVIHICRRDPPDNWPVAAYNLIGRNDLSQQKGSDDFKKEQTRFCELTVGEDGMDGVENDVSWCNVVSKT